MEQVDLENPFSAQTKENKPTEQNFKIGLLHVVILEGKNLEPNTGLLKLK